jgi:hypothetical protein
MQNWTESRFLSFAVLLPLIVDSFIVDWVVFFFDISIYLSQKKPIVKKWLSLHWIVVGLFRNILCLGQSLCIRSLVILLKKLRYALFIIGFDWCLFWIDYWICICNCRYLLLAFIVTMLYAFISKPDFQFPIMRRLWCILLLFYQEVSPSTFGYW